MTQDILGFFGENRWLSNFWPANILYEEILFPSVEHAYVYSKGNLSKKQLEKLLNSTPGQAKRFGREISLFSDFDEKKLLVMYRLVREKFSDANPELQRMLLATGDCNIVEVNNWGDTFWGVNEQGVGFNHLGNIIKIIRSELQNAKNAKCA